MYKLIYILYFLPVFWMAPSLAQTTPAVGLLLSRPALGKGIESHQQARMERQLLALFAGNENSMNSQFSAFVISSSLDIMEQGKIEGVKARQTVKLSLMLKLSNIYSGEVLDVREVTLTGAGGNTGEAVTKAIGNIRRNNPSLGKMADEFRMAIGEFYEKNCQSVLAAAKDFAQRQQNREAFALLQAVPSQTPCFAEVQAVKNDLYQKIQTAECAASLLKAQAAQAANDFNLALEMLSGVDAEAPCFEKAKSQITSLENLVDTDLQNRFEWLFKFYKEGKEAEAARWNAMSALYFTWLKENGKYLMVN